MVAKNVRHLDATAVEKLFKQAVTYFPTGTVHARPLTEDTEWETEYGDSMRGFNGDFLVSDGKSEWTVKASIFLDTYEHVEEDVWQKVAPIQAVVLEEAVTVDTLEGEGSGQPGDYLVRNQSGEWWIIPKDVFGRKYKRR